MQKGCLKTTFQTTFYYCNLILWVKNWGQKPQNPNNQTISQRERDSNPRCSYPHTSFPG